MTEIQEQPKKCAIYARVSPTKHIITKDDMHQSVEESLNVCRNASTQEGNIIVKEYVDQFVSGKNAKFMPQFQEMMKDASEGLFQRIYARRVNRFGRNRADMITAEMKLSGLGITIKFVESGIDTGMPMGKSIMAFMSELAEMDRNDILDNTKRGRELAKIKGTKSGKPFGHPRKVFNVEAVRMLRLKPKSERPTWKELETDFHTSRVVMIKRLKELGFWDERTGTVKSHETQDHIKKGEVP